MITLSHLPSHTQQHDDGSQTEVWELDRAALQSLASEGFHHMVFLDGRPGTAQTVNWVPLDGGRVRAEVHTAAI